ncbi:collagenase, putative [Candidatus Moduliflexus flocculans]|uniref:Collagenase, putative n=1 Tax=Candidatus Moduliflexus flocculans TaxID=1499966 RepID=A0A081BN25_9BACT|nr:collagenase, putative [Candidatus Moduliflexus flocculans]
MAKKQQKRCSQTPKIRKRLAAYSATAGAVLTLGSSVTLIMPDSSEAKVIYKDVNQPPLVSNTFTGKFGTAPFTIVHRLTFLTPNSLTYASISVGGGAVSTSAGSARALPYSNYISAVAGGANVNICTHRYNTATGGSAGNGNFPAGAELFIGVRFTLSGGTHYGWIRINVAAKCGSVEVVDYAYEDVPDTPIHLGAPAPVGGIVHDISDAGDASQE